MSVAYTGALWRKIQEGLDPRRLSAGERRSWTVRLEHGVYLVRLDESPLGNRLFVDGREVARTSSWDFEQPLGFDLGEARGEVRFSPDMAKGTLRTQLLVGGRLVDPDRPRSAARLRPFPWRTWLERAAYATGAALAIGGLVGDPMAAVVSRAAWTAALLVWSSGLSGIDPLGIVPFVVEHGLEGRPSMIVAGAEIAAIAALARDRFGIRRFVPLLAAPRWPARVAGWVLVVVAAIALLVVVV